MAFCGNLQETLDFIALNVPAVNDIFLRPIKNCEAFYGHKKMWRSKTP
jgi:hypothetical protein